jgi:hypothetical protein
MSRGHGRVQRDILAYLEEVRDARPRGAPTPIRAGLPWVVRALYGHEATEAQKVSVRRAVRALEREGLIVAERGEAPCHVRDRYWRPVKGDPRGMYVDRGDTARWLPVKMLRLTADN